MSTTVLQARLEAAAPNPAPHELIWTVTNAVVPSVCLHLVAELGLADLIGEEPVVIDELASRRGVDPEPLDRMLSLLAAHGIFRRDAGSYAHTPASRVLRSDHPMSMRAFPRMMGLPVFSKVLLHLEHSLRTGAPAIEVIEPAGCWAYLREHPDEAQIFSEAMTAKAAADIPTVLHVYDFSRFATIADIGGGRGHLLKAVIDATPGTDGVLFDLPAVIDAVDVKHERLTIRAGDFFADPLPAADAYVLMEVLHDWTDDQCVEILAAIRRAANPDATLLVIENVLTDRGTDPRGHTLDVIMLAVTGGRERTARELNELFRRGGFSEGKVIETAGPLRLVEATAV